MYLEIKDMKKALDQAKATIKYYKESQPTSNKDRCVLSKEAVAQESLQC